MKQIVVDQVTWDEDYYDVSVDGEKIGALFQPRIEDPNVRWHICDSLKDRYGLRKPRGRKTVEDALWSLLKWERKYQGAECSLIETISVWDELYKACKIGPYHADNK